MPGSDGSRIGRSRKIQLLLVTHNLDKGGAEEITLTCARLLDKSLFSVAVSCFEYGTVANEIRKIPEVHVFHIAARSRIRRLIALWGIARKLRPSIVHNVACWYGLLVGRLTGAKTIEMIQTTYQWFNWHERLRYGLYLLLARKIIAVSDAVAAFTVNFFPFTSREKFETIYNSVEMDRFSHAPPATNLKNTLGISLESCIVGFIGRLTEQKGVEYLIEAVSLINDPSLSVSVVIVGDGERREELKEMTKRKGLENVHFVGYRRDIPELLSLFDIFVLPSLWEGLPVVVVEAMAAGKPVVATRVSGSTEAVVENVTGFLVDPRDPGQLSEQLLKLIRDPELRQRMGAEGRSRAVNVFSARTMIEKTTHLYNKLLEQR